ncbi:hypothetical protein JMJ77_0014294, partial [Colletotrichum scovillei]
PQYARQRRFEHLGDFRELNCKRYVLCNVLGLFPSGLPTFSSEVQSPDFTTWPHLPPKRNLY